MMKSLTNSEKEKWPRDVVVNLERPFKDERGEILPLVDVDMKSCVLITSGKGTIRGNHYHLTDWHYCYVLKGSIEYYHRAHDSTEAVKKVLIKTHQMFFTPPMVEHAMLFLEDTVFLTFGRNSRKQEVYEADIVRIQLLNPKEVR